MIMIFELKWLYVDEITYIIIAISSYFGPTNWWLSLLLAPSSTNDLYPITSLPHRESHFTSVFPVNLEEKKQQ